MRFDLLGRTNCVVEGSFSHSVPVNPSTQLHQRVISKYFVNNNTRLISQKGRNEINVEWPRA